MKLDDIVDAFLKAIEDRVGWCNLCILAIKPKKSPYYLNRIVVGSFLAMQHNILTVATAGNYGPSIKLVWNVALWILMVGVSSSFKCFRTTMQVDALAFTEIIFFYFIFFEEIHGNYLYEFIYLLNRINISNNFTCIQKHFCFINYTIQAKFSYNVWFNLLLVFFNISINFYKNLVA